MKYILTTITLCVYRNPSIFLQQFKADYMWFSCRYVILQHFFLNPNKNNISVGCDKITNIIWRIRIMGAEHVLLTISTRFLNENFKINRFIFDIQ